MSIHVTVPGVPVTGNHARKTAGFREVWSPKRQKYAQVPNVYVTDEAKTYRERVGLITRAAMMKADMAMPEYCRIDILLWNVRGDRDNYVKELMDGLQGVACKTDARVLDGWIRKQWDDGEPRVEIWVVAVDKKDFDTRSRRRSAK